MKKKKVSKKKWIINPEWKKLSPAHDIYFAGGKDAFKSIRVGPPPK